VRPGESLHTSDMVTKGMVWEIEKLEAKALVREKYQKTPGGLIVLKIRRARKTRKAGPRRVCKVLQFPKVSPGCPGRGESS
jgi:hypothetical protein